MRINKDQLAGLHNQAAYDRGQIIEKMSGLAVRLQDILHSIAKIEPAQVDLTQEMADDIVRKIHGPLTIGKEFSDWIRQEAPHHDIFATSQIGYGAFAAQMNIILKTNGTLQLEMKDHFGGRLWFGTFVPPDFGGAKESI